MSTPKILNDSQLLKVINTLRDMASTKEMQFLSTSDNTAYRRKLTDEFPDFSMDYPGLFNTLIDNPKNFDMNRLMQMLAMKKKIQNRELTHEEASSKIGQQYYDEFAKPLVDKLPKK